MNNFPVLSSIKINDTKINNANLLNTIKEKLINSEINLKINNNDDKLGWTIIYKDKTNKKINMKKTILLKEQKINIEKDVTNNIFNNLILLHENKINKYIKNWGYDEYEKRFKFLNYNDEYNEYDEYDE